MMNDKLGVRSQETEDTSYKSQVTSQEPEDRSTEVTSHKSESIYSPPAPPALFQPLASSL